MAVDKCGQGQAKDSYRWTKDGEGWTRVGLDRGPEKSGWSHGAVHMVHGRARVHERDEDGISQVKEEGHGQGDAAVEQGHREPPERHGHRAAVAQARVVCYRHAHHHGDDREGQGEVGENAT